MFGIGDHQSGGIDFGVKDIIQRDRRRGLFLGFCNERHIVISTDKVSMRIAGGAKERGSQLTRLA